jgi:molecular chaperone Hsp33
MMFILSIGDGPLRGAVAISTGHGEVRGYVGSSMLNGFSLQDAVGKGTVQVVKNHPEWKIPYNGITEIRNGDVDRDIGLYLAESEQRSCALAAATCVEGILCKAAGGYLVEQLPGCDKSSVEVKRIEQNLADLVEQDGSNNPPSQILLAGMSPLDIITKILEGTSTSDTSTNKSSSSSWQILGQLEPSLKCSCNSDRLLRSLRLLPKEEVLTIIKEQGKIEARCHFCGTTYEMGPDEMMDKLEQVQATQPDPSPDA